MPTTFPRRRSAHEYHRSAMVTGIVRQHSLDVPRCDFLRGPAVALLQQLYMSINPLAIIRAMSISSESKHVSQLFGIQPQHSTKISGYIPVRTTRHLVIGDSAILDRRDSAVCRGSAPALHRPQDPLAPITDHRSYAGQISVLARGLWPTPASGLRIVRSGLRSDSRFRPATRHVRWRWYLSSLFTGGYK